MMTMTKMTMMTMMTQTMAMMALLMCSVDASVASDSFSARLPSESEWSMGEREMLKCCPATGSASCSWSRSLQLCLAADSLTPLSPTHYSTTHSFHSVTLRVDLWQRASIYGTLRWSSMAKQDDNSNNNTDTPTICIWMKTSKCLGDGTGMAAAPVQQALTSRRRSSVLYPELSLHIVNRRRATRATVSAH